MSNSEMSNFCLDQGRTRVSGCGVRLYAAAGNPRRTPSKAKRAIYGWTLVKPPIGQKAQLGVLRFVFLSAQTKFASLKGQIAVWSKFSNYTDNSLHSPGQKGPPGIQNIKNDVKTRIVQNISYFVNSRRETPFVIYNIHIYLYIYIY